MRLHKLVVFFLVPVAVTSCTTTDPHLPSTDVSAIENALTSAAFSIADKNGDNAVSFEEAQIADPESTREEFQLTDNDGSGSLSSRELEIGINRRGAFNRVVAKADTDGDGEVSQSEIDAFQKALSRAEKLTTFAQLKAILD